MSAQTFARCEAARFTSSTSISTCKSRTSAKRLFADRHPRNTASRATFVRSVTQASAEVPLADPVSLQPLNEGGFCASSGLEYGEKDGYWDLTIGAAKNKRASPAPASIVDLARDALPKELRGFLPKGDTMGTTTFELPSVAFAYERGWRQHPQRRVHPVLRKQHLKLLSMR
eukprot:3180631-Pyramimonas_sp.AAC.2